MESMPGRMGRIRPRFTACPSPAKASYNLRFHRPVGARPPLDFAKALRGSSPSMMLSCPPNGWDWRRTSPISCAKGKNETIVENALIRTQQDPRLNSLAASPSSSADSPPSVLKPAFFQNVVDIWKAIFLRHAVAVVMFVTRFSKRFRLVLFSTLIFLLFRPESANAMSGAAMANPLEKISSRISTDVIPILLSVLSVLKDQGLLLFFLLFLSAIFSMAETSIMNLSPWKIKELSEKESVFGLLKQDITRFLTTILFGTTVVNILATALVTQAATNLFGHAGVSAATGVMTVLLLLLTEIAPKSIAMHNATEVAKILVRPVYLLSKILYPVGKACAGISQGLLKILGLNTTLKTTVSEEELKLFLRRAESSGAIKEEEQDIIENVLEIKDIRVSEIMTPLINMIAIDASNSLSDFRELWIKNQFSRVPVFENRVDNIVGVAYAMDLLTNRGEIFEKVNVGKITRRPAYFVPESMSVRKLLKELKRRKIHMAIVLNEYGGTVGLVTLEDVVEEIVGENFDEIDSKNAKRQKQGQIVLRSERVFDIDASTSIEDFSETLNVFVPEEPFEFETVSGFVCGIFGKVPKIGESKRIKLLKLKQQEDNDWMENENETKNESNWLPQKFLHFQVEILAGDERKVRVVRFEQIAGYDEYQKDVESDSSTEKNGDSKVHGENVDSRQDSL